MADVANTNASGTTTSWACPNYVGPLYMVGSNNQTPFLNMIGGLQGGKVRLVNDFQFALAQPWDLDSAAQSTRTETGALNAPVVRTYKRGAKYNSVQIVQKAVTVTYAKQSVRGQVVADTTTYLVDAMETQPVMNELDFQITANLKQIAKDIEYSFLQGSYQQSTAANVAPMSRGICTAATANSVNASGADFSKSLLNQLLRTMADNGAEFDMPVIFVNGFQKQQISEVYGYAPEDKMIGGVNIKTIETDFAQLGVVYAPQMATNTLLVADLAYCRPVFLEVPGKGVLFYEELSKTGAAEKGQIYGQIGLDYGPHYYHGTITSLSTS